MDINLTLLNVLYFLQLKQSKFQDVQTCKNANKVGDTDFVEIMGEIIIPDTITHTKYFCFYP